MPNGQQVINMIEYLANNYADGNTERVELILGDLERVDLYVRDNEHIQFTNSDETYFRSQKAFSVHSDDGDDDLEEWQRYSHVTVLYN